MTIRPFQQPATNVPRDLILAPQVSDPAALRAMLQSTTSRPTGVLDAIGKLGTTAAVGITRSRDNAAKAEHNQAIANLLENPNISPQELMRAAVVSGNPQIAQIARMKIAQANTANAQGLAERRFGLQERQFDAQQKHQAALLALRQQELDARSSAAAKTSMQPFYASGPDGQLRAFAQTSDGRLVPLQGLPEGFTPAPSGIKTIDTGTGTRVIDRSGRVIGDHQKDIAGQEELKITGKATGERKANFRKNRNTLSSLNAQWDDVQDAIDDAKEILEAQKKQLFPTAVGPAGQALQGVGMTEAHKLAGVFDTLKSNIGFDKLQDMRANSPTGGALGNVSNAENRLLQSVQGALRIGDDPATILKRLIRIEQNFSQLRERVNADFRSTYNLGGGKADRSSAATSGAVGGIQGSSGVTGIRSDSSTGGPVGSGPRVRKWSPQGGFSD